jgi:hypothetical protein
MHSLGLAFSLRFAKRDSRKWREGRQLDLL